MRNRTAAPDLARTVLYSAPTLSRMSGTLSVSERLPVDVEYVYGAWAMPANLTAITSFDYFRAAEVFFLHGHTTASTADILHG